MVRRHLYIESVPFVVAVFAVADIIIIQETSAKYSHVPLVDHRVVVTLYERSDCDVNPGGLYTATFHLLITGSLLLCMRGQTVTSILVACIQPRSTC